MARFRHRADDDDADTDEIKGPPHRKLGTVLGSDGKTMVPDESNWSPCDCARGVNHT